MDRIDDAPGASPQTPPQTLPETPAEAPDLPPSTLAQRLTQRLSEAPVFRDATPDDVVTLVALRALMFTAMGTPTDVVSAAPWQFEANAWFRANLGRRRVKVVVAEVDGTVVACAMGVVVHWPPSPTTPTGAAGVLQNVATFPEYRGQGLAAACVDAVLLWFRHATDVGTVELFATPEGRPMYERRGFVEHEFATLRLSLDRKMYTYAGQRANRHSARDEAGRKAPREGRKRRGRRSSSE